MVNSDGLFSRRFLLFNAVGKLTRSATIGILHTIGATVQMEFLADGFATDSAEVLINPPEGDSVAVDFDLYALR